jgi:hypothetical protein
MMKLIRILFLFLLGLKAASCTERINIDLDESTVRLVVEGTVTTDTMAHKVILSKSTSYYYSQKAPVVSGASVSISVRSSIIQLHESAPGVYETDSTFFGIVGEAYTLDIRLDSAVGGFSEYSATSVMVERVSIDSLQLLFHPDWSENGFWEVKCFFQDSPSENYYRFLVSRNGKLITDTLDKWFVSDDRFFSGDYVEGATVAVLDQGSEDEMLNNGDTVTIELNCIGRDYAGFISEAQAELMGSNPFFSGPPANVTGNISNGAIGFFSAHTTSRSVVKAPGLKKT